MIEETLHRGDGRVSAKIIGEFYVLNEVSRRVLDRRLVFFDKSIAL